MNIQIPFDSRKVLLLITNKVNLSTSTCTTLINNNKCAEKIKVADATERSTHMLKIKGFLTDTCTNVEHPRVKELKIQLENAAKEKNGELRNIYIMEPGVVVIDITPTETEKSIADAIGNLPGVTITPITGFEMQHQKNQALQSKIDKNRETKKRKKAGLTSGKQ